MTSAPTRRFFPSAVVRGGGAGAGGHADQVLTGEGRNNDGLVHGLKLVLNGKAVVAGQPVEVKGQLLDGAALEGKGLLELVDIGGGVPLLGLGLGCGLGGSELGLITEGVSSVFSSTEKASAGMGVTLVSTLMVQTPFKNEARDGGPPRACDSYFPMALRTSAR